MTGLLASLLASIQIDDSSSGDETNLRFSVTVFFLLLALVMLSSAFAFLFLLKNMNRIDLWISDLNQNTHNINNINDEAISIDHHVISPVINNLNSDHVSENVLQQNSISEENVFNNEEESHNTTTSLNQTSKYLITITNPHLVTLIKKSDDLKQGKVQSFITFLLYTNSGHIFILQALISYLENGIFITLLPRALG